MSPQAPSTMKAPSEALAGERAPRAASSEALARRLASALIVVLFFLGLFVLFVREVLVPRVEDFRPQIAAALEHAIGLPVSIDRLSADWQGLRPRLHLAGMTVLDRRGEPALRLERVDGTLAWSSVWRARAYFHQLVLFSPELALHREVDGHWFVAGIRIDPTAPRANFSDWLLGQREIVIVDAALSWSDRLREAPLLRLEAVDFRMSNIGARYRFGLHARPPSDLAARLELRGDLVGVRPGDPGSWDGQLYLGVDGADLGAWQSWVDYPVPVTGSGALQAWADVRHGRLDGLVADVALDEVTTRLAHDLPELRLDAVRGRLSGRWLASGYELSARGLEVVAGEILQILPTDIDLELRGVGDDVRMRGALRANRLDLGVLAGLAAYLPFDDSMRARLAGFEPRGRLDDLSLDWQGHPGNPSAWEVHARFADLAIKPEGLIPGLSGFSGELSGDQDRGRFRLAGVDAILELPGVFPAPRLGFSSLQAEGGWGYRDARREIVLDGLRFENPDAAGSASGRYLPAAGGRGEIDLAARLSRAEGKAVWRYLPRVVNEATRNWLRDSLSGGVVPEARLRLVGDLDDFPFDEGQPGQFLVTAHVAGATLRYADNWPAIEDIDGELRFEGAGMRISADSARLFDVGLAGVVAEVPDLDAPAGPVMTLRGQARGASADFLRFIAVSPVQERIGTFTDGLRAEGRGALDLTLVIPLRDIEQTTVDGEFRFAGNRVTVLEGLPALTDARARVRFTRDTLSIGGASAQALGEPLNLSASTREAGVVSFRVEGGATMRALRETYDWPILDYFSGTAAWQADIDIGPQSTRVSVASNLEGITSSLPQPLDKLAAEQWPLQVRVDTHEQGAHEHIQGEIAGRGVMEFVRRRMSHGWEVERGGVSVLAPLALMERGILVSADLETLDIDAWRRVLRQGGDEPAVAGGAVAGIDLRAQRVTAFGRTFSDFELGALSDEGGWKGRLASDVVEGSFDWRGAGQGALHARLNHLSIGIAEDPAHDPDVADVADVDFTDEPLRQLPALDVVAERFSLRGRELGRLELQAINEAGRWALDELVLENKEGRFRGTGQWQPGREPLTELEFGLEASDIGDLLARLGYPEAVRRGTVVLSGQIAWRGPPTGIDHPTLSGQIDLQARNGQFRQLEPGVGRLLGVLSLQSLPRRLTLDFRDVFSEGFAFDSVSGSISMAAGVLHTDNLHIAGPAARIWIGGSANVARETQDLRVIVQPTLSESIAVGAAAGLINPVAGVLAYIAQKVLSDPIERMFAYTYAITGSWADPKVEKLAGGAPADDVPHDGER